MDTTYIFLQQYWWFLISLLGALLVFLLFVQGGQSLLYEVGKRPMERTMIVNALGRKWEFTFTTLVVFGGAFFASFPLFYSTSFSGAFYVWMAILFFFVIQAVSYEYRRKPGNFLGEKTYNWFLLLNGIFGTLLLGVAVGTFFTGANFVVNRANLADFGGNTAISQWTTPWRGLEALADFRNVALGLAVFFLSRILGLEYFMNSIDDRIIRYRSRKLLLYNTLPFLAFFLFFLGGIMIKAGWDVDQQTGFVSMVDNKYFQNLLDMPLVAVLFLAGVVCVVTGVVRNVFFYKRGGIWWSGIGTILAVLSLFLLAGYNHTAYYPSLYDSQSSLTIYNSSSSYFTLKVMAYVSLLIPFVVAYIWWAWRAINKKPINRYDIDKEEEKNQLY